MLKCWGFAKNVLGHKLYFPPRMLHFFNADITLSIIYEVKYFTAPMFKVFKVKIYWVWRLYKIIMLMKQNVTNNASKNPLSMARHFDSWQKNPRQFTSRPFFP